MTRRCFDRVLWAFMLGLSLLLGMALAYWVAMATPGGCGFYPVT